MKALKGWTRGCYAAPDGIGLRLVVVGALPVMRDTLALRLLGRGSVLRAASQELLALPADAWERRMVTVLLRWTTRILEIEAPRSPDEEDYLVTGQQILDEIEQRATSRGIAKGAAPLMRLMERRVGRALSEAERREVLTRLDTLGPERVGDVLLDLAPGELAAWLADPDAR